MKINNLYDTKQMKISAIQINTCRLQMKFLKKTNKIYTIQMKNYTKVIQYKLNLYNANWKLWNTNKNYTMQKKFLEYK